MEAHGGDENRGMRMLTGILLILTPIAFNVFFTLLSVTFEYPDILREPTGYVLRSFDAGGGGLVAIWYGFMLTAVLFVPLAVLVHRVLAREDTPYMAVATAFGVVAGVVQFLGLVRWPFLVPYLADTYLDPASSVPPASRSPSFSRRSTSTQASPWVRTSATSSPASGSRWSRWPCSGRRYPLGGGWPSWGWCRPLVSSSAPSNRPGSNQPQTS